MIHQRISALLRTQNWVGVLIEFILIVAGVLIALEVNNWNEQRKDSQLEREYIKRIISDLEMDVVDFQNIQRASQNRLASGLKLRDIITTGEGNENDLTNLVKLIRESGFTARPNVSDYTFEALKSGGNLHLIQSAALQSDLLAYYANLTRRRQYDYIVEDGQLKYIELTSGILTMDLHDRFFAQQDETISLAEGQVLLSKIHANKEFVKLLPRVIINQRNFYNDAIAAEKRAQLLVESLSLYISAE